MSERIVSASNSKLPRASAAIDDGDTMREATGLLKKLVNVKTRISELEEEERDMRDRLAAICQAYDLTAGFRHGMAGFEYHGYTTRKTLNKELLLAAGVSAQTIAESYKEGEPYLSCKVVVFDVE